MPKAEIGPFQYLVWGEFIQSKMGYIASALRYLVCRQQQF